MTILRAYPAGWGVGEKLTSAQQNAVDVNTTNAADKRAAQTDTIAAVWTCAGAGRLINTTVAGANVDTTYAISGGNSTIYLDASITADRIYTLSHTDATPGDILYVYGMATLTKRVTIKDGGTTLFAVGNAVADDGNFASFIFLGSSWNLYQSSTGARLRFVTFTAVGTFLVPARVNALHLLGWGGGGGGGGGAGGHLLDADYYPTGGGGGGAVLAAHNFRTVTPGTSLAVGIGTGGSSGAGGSDGAGNNGGDGSNTTFDGTAVGSGATGGRGGKTTTGLTGAQYVNGGKPTPVGVAIVDQLGESPGWGGFSGDVRSLVGSGNGATSIEGYTGGTAGVGGTSSGGYRAGGGGGGGAAGPGGAGGNGGAGSNGNSAADGSAGAAGAANSGSGGGGGGGSGGASVGAVGVGGNGAVGATGKLFVGYVN